MRVRKYDVISAHIHVALEERTSPGCPHLRNPNNIARPLFSHTNNQRASESKQASERAPEQQSLTIKHSSTLLYKLYTNNNTHNTPTLDPGKRVHNTHTASLATLATSLGSSFTSTTDRLLADLAFDSPSPFAQPTTDIVFPVHFLTLRQQTTGPSYYYDYHTTTFINSTFFLNQNKPAIWLPSA